MCAITTIFLSECTTLRPHGKMFRIYLKYNKNVFHQFGEITQNK